MLEDELLADPLHALWATSDGSSRSTDAEGTEAPALGQQLTLSQVGQPESWLLMGDDELRGDGLQVTHAGTFRRRIFERSPSSASDAGARRLAPYVLSVQLFVPDAEQQHDCRRWLDEEHFDRQLAVPGTHWYGGYESEGGDFNFLNLWGLDSPAVIETPEWAEARDTPWRMRLLERGIARTERAVFQWYDAERTSQQ